VIETHIKLKMCIDVVKKTLKQPNILDTAHCVLVSSGSKFGINITINVTDDCLSGCRTDISNYVGSDALQVDE
jgi:hypothetical protein